MVCAGIIFFFFGQLLTAFFTGGSNPATSAQAAFLLKLASVAMPSLAIAMIMSGALRGAGDTRWPMAINLIGMLGVRIPGAYLVVGPLAGLASQLAPARSDGILIAAWCVMILDLTIRALLVWGCGLWIIVHV